MGHLDLLDNTKRAASLTLRVSPRFCCSSQTCQRRAGQDLAPGGAHHQRSRDGASHAGGLEGPHLTASAFRLRLEKHAMNVGALGDVPRARCGKEGDDAQRRSPLIA